MDEIWIFLLVIVLVIVFICLAAFVFFNGKTNTPDVENFNLEVNITDNSINFNLRFEGDSIKIDWGDGTIETYDIKNKGIETISHKYNYDRLYIVKGYNASNITIFVSNYPQSGGDITGTISSLNFTNFKSLKEISFARENLTSIDITSLTNLERFLIPSNHNLSDINLINSSKLTTINCERTAISSLDLQYTPDLTYLDCSNTNVSTLDLQYVPKLTYLNCSNTNVSTLDLQYVPKLTYLNCSNTNVSSLDLQYTPDLTYLDCSNTNVSTLDLQYVPKLTYLNCYNLGLSQPNVDTILSQLVTNDLSDGYADILGNSPPSDAGLISKGILETKGWTVLVD
jgi:hypothetical protein